MMDYNYYKSDIAQLMEVSAEDPLFLNNLPSVIAVAENRIYREIDLLSTVVSDSSRAFTANTRKLALPTAVHFVTTQQVNAITPISAASPDLGTRNALTPVTKEFLDAVYNSSTGAALPQYYAHAGRSDYSGRAVAGSSLSGRICRHHSACAVKP